MSIFESIPPFFEGNDFFINEKVRLLSFTNVYDVFNEKGEKQGAVVQKMSAGLKFLQLILNKAMFPFKLEIRDHTDQTLAVIKRGWTFWMSKITILNSFDEPIGFVKQKFKFFKPTFRVFSKDGDEIAIITGDWKAWNFVINDVNGNQIGTINKKWAGIAQEVFTTADKYHVWIDPAYAEDRNKINILSTAIAIDMIMKESK